MVFLSSIRNNKSNYLPDTFWHYVQRDSAEQRRLSRTAGAPPPRWWTAGGSPRICPGPRRRSSLRRPPRCRWSTWTPHLLGTAIENASTRQFASTGLGFRDREQDVAGLDVQNGLARRRGLEDVANPGFTKRHAPSFPDPVRALVVICRL